MSTRTPRALQGLRLRAEALWLRVDGGNRVAVAIERCEPLLAGVRPVVRTLTPLGRGALGAALLAWFLGVRLGWVELLFVASACLLALLISIPFVVGGAVLGTQIELDPVRVFVGTPSAGRLLVTNQSRRRLFPLQVDLPVGAAVARFDVPSLGGDQVHEEIFVVPTNKRAVITVGPASSVQGDPLGLLKNEIGSKDVIELFIHPTVVALPSLGSGLLRDLEGQTTRDLSASDLAFHTLRDYVPGDDRRYIHWKSSAKAGKLLVRQFLDTRRSRVTIAVDADAASYRDENEFEVAMSVAGSLGVRCLLDGLDVTVVGGGHATTPSSSQRLLDTLSRAELADDKLALLPAAQRAAALATDTSLAVLITGSAIPFYDLRAASTRFGPDVTALAVRVETDAPAGISRSGGITVLAVRSLSDLPRLLVGAAS